jgi:hypothetical protein
LKQPDSGTKTPQWGLTQPDSDTKTLQWGLKPTDSGTKHLSEFWHSLTQASEHISEVSNTVLQVQKHLSDVWNILLMIAKHLSEVLTAWFRHRDISVRFVTAYFKHQSISVRVESAGFRYKTETCRIWFHRNTSYCYKYRQLCCSGQQTYISFCIPRVHTSAGDPVILTSFSWFSLARTCNYVTVTRLFVLWLFSFSLHYGKKNQAIKFTGLILLTFQLFVAVCVGLCNMWTTDLYRHQKYYKNMNLHDKLIKFNALYTRPYRHS